MDVEIVESTLVGFVCAHTLAECNASTRVLDAY